MATCLGCLLAVLDLDRSVALGPKDAAMLPLSVWGTFGVATEDGPETVGTLWGAKGAASADATSKTGSSSGGASGASDSESSGSISTSSNSCSSSSSSGAECSEGVLGITSSGLTDRLGIVTPSRLVRNLSPWRCNCSGRTFSRGPSCSYVSRGIRISNWENLRSVWGN